MKTGRYVLIILAIGIIAGQIIVIDFSNPGWRENAGSYLSILAMILLIVAMVISLRDLKKKYNKP